MTEMQTVITHPRVTRREGGHAHAGVRPRTERRADLEWLRVIAMFTVFIAHVAHVFTPWQYWHIQNDTRSELLGQLTLFVWPWVMPLFMLLAGAGAWFSLSRRGDRDFSRERTKRLLIPFLIGTLVLIPPQIWVERLAQGRFDGSLIRFYPHFFECCYPASNLAAGHLWFIAYLWVYSIALVPLIRQLERPAGRRWMAALARAVNRRGGVLVLGAPLVVTQVALRGVFPQSLDFVTDWANHALFIPAYLFGYLLLSQRALQTAVDTQWRLALAPAAVASMFLAAYAARLGAAAGTPAPYSGVYFAFWTAFGVATSCWMVALIGMTRRYLRATPPLLIRGSRAVYPIYLLHQTVIVLIAYRVVQWPIGLLPRFAAVLVLSFAVTAVLAELMTRVTPVRRLLGLKKLSELAVLNPPAPRRARPS